MPLSDEWIGVVGALGGTALGLAGTYVLGQRDQRHASSQAKATRAHERRLVSWRAHREATAEFLRALEKAKYDINDWGERRIELSEKYLNASVDERMQWNADLKALADKAFEAMLQITYWAALLPTDLRDVARQAQEEIQNVRHSYFMAANMRGDANELAKDGEESVAREVRMDAMKTMKRAHSAFLGLHATVSRVAIDWLDAHQAPDVS